MDEDSDNPQFNLHDLVDELLWKREYEVQPDVDSKAADILWACYFVDTDSFDSRIELIAEALHHPITMEALERMTQHTQLCRRVIQEIAQNSDIELGYPSYSRFARYKPTDLHRIVYGTKWWEEYRRVKARLIPPMDDLKVRLD